MKKSLVLSLLIFAVGCAAFLFFWLNTQPVLVVSKKIPERALKELPIKNRKLLEYIEAHGSEIAPNYDRTVCTEFVIKVLDSIELLTKKERRDIRIITDDDLASLIKADAPIIKGVQTALTKTNKGTVIESEKVLPGDLVQFWNVLQGTAYGHCGVVLDINPNESITLYSSHPLTGGFGRQEFLWPEKTYFVRLK